MRSIIYIVIMTLLIVTTMITSSISNLLDEYIDYNLNFNKQYREITVNIYGDTNNKYKDKISKYFDGYKFIEDVEINQIEDLSISGESITSIVIQIDNYNNVEEVKNKLITEIDEITNEYDYEIIYDDSVINENKMINNVKLLFDIMVFVIIVLTFITINIVIKQSIDENRYNIAIYKSCGYLNRHIFQVIFLESFIISTISNLFSIGISRVILDLVIKILSRISYIDIVTMNININLTFLPCIVLVYTICLLVLLLELIRIKKVSINMLINQFD